MTETTEAKGRVLTGNDFRRLLRLCKTSGFRLGSEEALVAHEATLREAICANSYEEWDSLADWLEADTDFDEDVEALRRLAQVRRELE